MTISAVIFDIGNVLIEWHPEAFYDDIIGVENRTRMFKETQIMKVHESCDAGADFYSTIYSLAEKYPQWAKEIRLWFDRWDDMAAPNIEGSLHLLRALKRNNIPVFALTNFATGALVKTYKACPFLLEFDKRYVSGDLKCIKPDPEIYKIVEEDNEIDPKEFLFIDDRKDNIATANGRGWQTHHFTGPTELADRLIDENLLSAIEANFL